jgi:hypothetical protein
MCSKPPAEGGVAKARRGRGDGSAGPAFRRDKARILEEKAGGRKGGEHSARATVEGGRRWKRQLARVKGDRTVKGIGGGSGVRSHCYRLASSGPSPSR